MKSKLYLLAVAIGMIALSSCKKFDNKPITKPKKIDTDVYVSGILFTKNGNSVAAYWKNGIIHKLTDSSTNDWATAIAVKDSDVYVTGTITNPDGSNSAAYWKNGQMVVLDNNAQPTRIALSPCGCDFYIAGYVKSGKRFYAAYWKNGIQHRLPSGSAYMNAMDIALQGNDVYVSGFGISASNNQYAVYWKNDSLRFLADSTTLGSAEGIAVQGNDVYIGGFSPSGATFWKNGTPTILPEPPLPDGSQVTALVVKGSNVYTSVSEGLLSSYWVNTTKLNLIGTQPIEAFDITLVGNDVYVAGWTSVGGKSPIACYWKNGQLVPLPSLTGGSYNQGAATFGIAVVTHPH